MDYFHRLLLRASAAPRPRSEALFDPFAQTAPWPAEPPTQALATPDPFAAAPMAAQFGPSAEAPPRATPAEATQSLRAPGVAALAADAGVTLRAPTSPVPPVPASPPSSPQASDAMAHADAFMRSLGVPGLAAEAAPGPSMVRPASPAPVTAARPSLLPLADVPDTESVAAARRTTAHPPAAAQAAQRDAAAPLMRPPRLAAPPAPPPMPPQEAPAARRPPAPPASEPPEQRAVAAVHKRAVAPAVIETTVFIPAPASSRRLDDVAHGASIERFGLGQS